MLETSNDLFWIVLSGSIGLLTLFACWGIFYLVMIIRGVAKSVKRVEKIFESIHDIIKTTKDKIENSAAYFSVIGDGIKKVMEVAKENGVGVGKTKKKGRK